MYICTWVGSDTLSTCSQVHVRTGVYMYSTCLRACMRVASSSWLEFAATSSAVNPCSVTALTSHPETHSWRTSSTWPYLDARWRGVAPFWGRQGGRNRKIINQDRWIRKKRRYENFSLALYGYTQLGCTHVHVPYWRYPGHIWKQRGCRRWTADLLCRHHVVLCLHSTKNINRGCSHS